MEQNQQMNNLKKIETFVNKIEEKIKESGELDEIESDEQEASENVITDVELRKFVIPILRAGSYRFSERSEAVKMARASRGLYKCAMCGQLLKKGEYAVDHVDSIIPVTGWTNWDDYIHRMFCHRTKFQILCKNTCHAEKTKHENAQRKINKAVKKKLAKEKEDV